MREPRCVTTYQDEYYACDVLDIVSYSVSSVVKHIYTSLEMSSILEFSYLRLTISSIIVQTHIYKNYTSIIFLSARII